jgi:beta-hydroxylase
MATIEHLLKGRYIVLALFVACTIYVQLRGKARLRWSRQLLDHSMFMAPYNALMYLFSAVTAEPFADLRQFAELDRLSTHWQDIRDEACGLLQSQRIRAADAYNDAGFNSFFRHGWKRFYLKWYDDALPSARTRCPRTVELLRQVPSINAALFALLPAGSRLGAHRDPFAGSLRYHLGLMTPNSERCRIMVDGQPYHWRDGEGVIFDETLVHSAENLTDETRLILLCDIERPISNPVVRLINRTLGRTIMRAAATQNEAGEPVGALNHLLSVLYQVRLLGKRLKQWHQPTYYAVKWTLVGWLVYSAIV